jgi:hypothetical protein
LSFIENDCDNWCLPILDQASRWFMWPCHASQKNTTYQIRHVLSTEDVNTTDPMPFPNKHKKIILKEQSCLRSDHLDWRRGDGTMAWGWKKNQDCAHGLAIWFNRGNNSHDPTSSFQGNRSIHQKDMLVGDPKQGAEDSYFRVFENTNRVF